METVRILEVKQSVFANNDAQADKLRQELKQKGIYLLNLMSSPGSGKTTITKRLVERFKDNVSVINHDNYYKAHKQHKTEESEEEVYG